jgi:topoisomerase-4 subunit A
LSEESNPSDPTEESASEEEEPDDGVIHIDDMYKTWFVDYASYVILERAVPHIDDGLKPVQRRILHSLKELDDGRFNKVANVVGNTMKYHPHGDSAIGEAIVQLGQKDLLIETQGNWGNILTGDRAAASRYIEARLSKFALDVAFNAKTTDWALSYDGRNKEPVTLPMKFPLLLAQGAEGIAVGLACKILPHNFIELIEACIAILRKEKTQILPDFPTGGIMDASDYNSGLRGGKVRVRARIERTSNKKILRIIEIPFGTTTGALMDNIVATNEKGKIKIAKIEDITAAEVEILIHLPAGADPDLTIESLYAFTDCEVSISPNSCIIQDNKPKFLPVDEILKHSAFHTKDLLEWELKIRLGELEDKWHFSSLEKIFIENRIYRRIEESTTWESVMEEIWTGLKPFLKLLRRIVTDDDVVRLTEIKIKRISKFDAFKADEYIQGLEDQIAEVTKDLGQLTRYAIRYYKDILKRYGTGRERKTEISSFDRVDAKKVAVANEILYLNAKDGFIGWGLKKDANARELCKCSRIDEVIIFGNDGTMQVTKISEKAFVGKNPEYVALFDKEEPVYCCMIYRDGRVGKAMAKHFEVKGVTRDKVYHLTKGTPGSRVLFFSHSKSPDDALKVKVHLKPVPRLRSLEIDFDFADLGLKGRGVLGNMVTKHSVAKIIRA